MGTKTITKYVSDIEDIPELLLGRGVLGLAG
jgi:hypothetical protein